MTRRWVAAGACESVGTHANSALRSLPSAHTPPSSRPTGGHAVVRRDRWRRLKLAAQCGWSGMSAPKRSAGSATPSTAPSRGSSRLPQNSRGPRLGTTTGRTGASGCATRWDRTQHQAGAYRSGTVHQRAIGAACSGSGWSWYDDRNKGADRRMARDACRRHRTRPVRRRCRCTWRDDRDAVSHPRKN